MNLQITDVRAVPGDSAFLIDDGETAILYDSGFAFTGFQVADNIQSVLGKRKLNYIFLTHSHYDHALGSVYAKEYWPEAKVVAGEYAVKIFDKPSAKAVMRDLDYKFAQTCGVKKYDDLIDKLSVDISVKEGDVIHAGAMDFTVINLPGHTRCSIGFYLKEKELLLSSETLGVFDGDKIIVPSYLVGYQMTLDSIAKARSLPIKNILLPHLGLVDEEKTRFYLEHAEKSSKDTAEGILAILDAGGSEADAMQYMKDRFYHGYVQSIYPIDAMELNTSIMIKLLLKELRGIESAKIV